MLQRLIQTYLNYLAVERGASEHTLSNYRRDLARYAAFLTQHGIDDIAAVSAQDISAFGVSLHVGDEEHGQLAPSSATRTLVAVRSLHRFALNEDQVTTDVSANLTLPKQGTRLPKALGISQVQAILNVPDRESVAGLRDGALFELLYGTGARISEALGLDVDDFNNARDSGVFRFFGKGRKERIVPLGSYAQAAIDAWLVRGRPTWAAKAKRATPALLLNKFGNRLSRQSAWQLLRTAAQTAGITAEISPHTLRHSFATHLLDGGADVRVVQELLGHASVTTTQLYTLVTVDHLREVFQASHPRAGS
ncbi:MAG: site-specific tyrosine recombinase XerD [Propionibacteriaceae bacterium]|nr:site-specific tyrosine recombinase XerD [Propionibacteriaceae bacterium]